MNNTYKCALVGLCIMIMLALFTGCGRQLKTSPTVEPINILKDLNEVNIKNANLTGSSIYEDGRSIYYVNSDKDIVRYDSTVCTKTLIADLNSVFTGFLHLQDSSIYFLSTDNNAQDKIQAPSAYVVENDGSGMKKLFDNALSLNIIDDYLYYIDSTTNQLYKYDLSSGNSEKVLDNNVDDVDVAGDKIYYVEAADPANNIDLSIMEFDTSSKEKKTILSSDGIDPSKLKDAKVYGLQYYDGSLYFIVNSFIRKFNLDSEIVETIGMNPSASNSRINGLLISYKGIYFYTSEMDDSMTVKSSCVYDATAKVVMIYKTDDATILSINLTQKYILIDTFDKTFKKNAYKIINYAGQEVHLDL